MYKILEKKDEDGLVYAVQEDSDPHPQVRVLHLNNLLSCQGFQGFENTNIQAQIPSKSAQTRGAKRKEHQRVSNYLESTDFLVKMKRPILGQDSQEANISPYKKKRTCSQVRISHLIIQEQRKIVKDTVETITNSVKVRIALNKQGKLTIELKVKSLQPAPSRKNQNINQE